MSWYPVRVLPSLAIVVGFILGCAHARGTRPTEPAPNPLPSPTDASTVTFDEEDQRATSLEQLLAGRIAGVIVTSAPGGGIRVRMAGPTSFYSGQDPLFVVDGAPIEGSNGTLSWLSPRDVESIQALKDPSQTAIYGVRGANGVIIIKTRGAH
jgi:TonB-dependent SusC/RagA subfamily outer membrane receptor